MWSTTLKKDRNNLINDSHFDSYICMFVYLRNQKFMEIVFTFYRPSSILASQAKNNDKFIITKTDCFPVTLLPKIVSRDC